MLDGHQILKLNKPERLFTGTTEDEIKSEFRSLARQYHPDRSPLTVDVFAKVNDLYHQALKRLQIGNWGDRGGLIFELKNGKHITIHSLIDRPFELGHLYIGHDHVTYTIKPEYKQMCIHAAAFRFDYADENMADQFARYLPKGLANSDSFFELKNGDYGLTYKKDPQLFSLRDVLNRYEGRIPGRHVAWIIGTLGNLVCYLAFKNLSHQDISIDTYYINPRQHTGALLGGWWYATKFRRTVKHVPTRTLDLLPFEVKRTKKASPLTDLELIRGVGREILGDNPNVPKPIEKWLKSIATKSAVQDYSGWIKARDASGRRKFIKMRLTEEDLYG